MAKMTHTQRIKNAIALEEVDRIPAGIWGHRPFAEQDPMYLAETQLAIAMENDFDFIKINPDAYVHIYDFGVSSVMHTSPSDQRKTEFRRSLIRTEADWRALEPIDGHYGALGRAVNVTKYMQRLQKEAGVEIPYIVTFNSPLTNVLEMATGLANKEEQLKLIAFFKENRSLFHEVLQKVTDTGISYIKANLEYAPAGFFFATRFANYDFFTEEEYDEFGTQYDLQLFRAFQDETYFNMLHIHGQNAMWEKIANYPGNVINWHDQWIPPTLEEGRKLCGKCIEGGLDERKLAGYTPEEVKRHVKESVERAGRRGLIIGNGCGTWPWPSDENLHAITEALDEIG